MKENFQIIKSFKSGINSPDSYIVIRGNISYLRILGKYPNWALMTATASEDDKTVSVCADQRKLIESAFILCKHYGGVPLIKKDWTGRNYALIGCINKEENESSEDFEIDYTSIIRNFFSALDEVVRPEIFKK